MALSPEYLAAIAEAIRNDPDNSMFAEALGGGGSTYDGNPVETNTPLENGQWTGEFTGKGGNDGYQYWDSASQTYRVIPIEDLSSVDGGWYRNAQGEFVFGTTPEDKHWNPTDEVYQEGLDPYAGKREVMPDPNNDTPVPWTVPNPDYDPDAGYGEYDPLPNDPNYGGGGGGGAGGGGTGGGGGGTGGGTGGANTSWDWSKFQGRDRGPEAPPVTADYSAGEGSPWGNEGVPGDNQDYYRNQFNNLNAQSQAHQYSALGAALRRQASDQNPQESPAMDWSWANGGQGLPEVVTSGQEGADRYNLREGFDTNTTNYEIMNAALGAGWNDNEGGYPIGPNNSQLSGTNWANATNPNDLYASMPQGADQDWAEMLRKGMNYAFTDSNIESPEGGGPKAAPGYAAPIGSY